MNTFVSVPNIWFLKTLFKFSLKMPGTDPGKAMTIVKHHIMRHKLTEIITTRLSTIQLGRTLIGSSCLIWVGKQYLLST